MRSHGFEVFGVACKAGATPKSSVGIPEACNGVGTNMCNPILQAKMLNHAKTDLTKKDVQKYLKNQKEEHVNTAFAEALSGIKLQ